MNNELYDACEAGTLGNDPISSNYLNIQCFEGSTPLFIAAKKGHTAIVKRLLDAKADPNILNYEQKNPLFFACLNGYSDIVRALIDAGANVNQMDTYNEGSLFAAVAKGHIEIAKMLLDAGADVKTKHNNYSILIMAIYYARSETLANILIDAGADIHQHSVGAAHTAIIAAVSRGFKTLVSRLISMGASLNITEGSLFYIRCYCEDNVQPLDEIREMLVDAGLDVNQDNGGGFRSVCENGSARLIKKMIRKGANIDSKDESGRTCLHSAALYKNIEGMKVLLEAGAAKHIYAKDAFNNTPMSLAKEKTFSSSTDEMCKEAEALLLQYAPEPPAVDTPAPPKPEFYKTVLHTKDDTMPQEMREELATQVVEKIIANIDYAKKCSVKKIYTSTEPKYIVGDYRVGAYAMEKLITPLLKEKMNDCNINARCGPSCCSDTGFEVSWTA